MKQCLKCRKTKALSEFYAGNGAQGRRSRCIACLREAATAEHWRDVDKSRAKQAERARRWRAANREKAREASRLNQRRHTRELREKIRVGMGGKCAHCPVTDARLLHIDHKDDDGSADRTAFNGNKTAYYNHVLENTDRYQLLCPNCNHRKRLKASTGPTTKASAYTRKYATRIRREAIVFLGGACKACNEDDSDILCIDHKTGRGRQARLTCGGSNAMYKDVPENPRKYQLLCHNCNWVKRHDNHEW